jgi:hypothetical protein
MTKICSKCKETKNVTEFHKNKARKDGLEAYCKICACEQKRQRRKNGGNFTHKQKEITYKKCGYFCQICGNDDLDKLQVDHLLPQIVCNPNTASVDANAWVLCVSCNRAKDKRIILELIIKVPKYVLGPMLLKEYANAINQGEFDKVPISINGKEFTEVKLNW